MPQTIALLGDPVSHSRSPAMHNAAFKALGLDLHYEAWHTPSEQLEERVAALRQAHILGANVTLPHKAGVIPLIDRLEPEAERIGAVNTIYKDETGALIGANTDAPALIEDLQVVADYNPHAQSVILLGASGAARAAAFALAGAGVRQLVIVNRTVERAEELLADVIDSYSLLEELPAFLALAPQDEGLAELVGESSLIINATSLGWHGDETPLAGELIPAGALVYDMVYRHTRLLQDAEARGARALQGLGMLMRQGALAFERWTHQPAPRDVMWQALQS
jgi:shikimate dehydrogenase